MRNQFDLRLMGNFAVGGGFIALGMFLNGCSAPNPNTAAGQSEIAGQKCAVCRAQTRETSARAMRSACSASRTRGHI
jgi:hypothetical protein